MSRLLMFIAFGLSTVVPVAANSGKHLFILSGQSNMAGLKPEASFTPAVEKELGEGSVIVVKEARGGQPIRRWYKEWQSANGGGGSGEFGDLYDRLMRKVREATSGQELASVTFVWMQGERDAKEGHGAVYAASLKGLIEQLRSDLSRKDMSFVIGRLSDFGTENKSFKDWTMVREAQVAVAEADPHGAWVDTDDLNDKEGPGGIRHDLHYTREGYRILGERFASEALALVAK